MSDNNWTWKSIGDCPPPRGEEVVLYHECGMISVLQIVDEVHGSYTHWMPIPPPPPKLDPVEESFQKWWKSNTHCYGCQTCRETELVYNASQIAWHEAKEGK